MGKQPVCQLKKTADEEMRLSWAELLWICIEYKYSYNTKLMTQLMCVKQVWLIAPKRSDVWDKLGREIRRPQYQCVDTQASEESTRLTLTGLGGVRIKSEERPSWCPLYAPQRGRGVEGSGAALQEVEAGSWMNVDESQCQWPISEPDGLERWHLLLRGYHMVWPTGRVREQTWSLRDVSPFG